MKVGVIGAGAMGKHHARIYSELPDVELIGIADINIDLASSVAKQFNTKAYSSHEELMEQNLDAVSVVVPTSLHKKIVVDAANAGINILVEKPIADTVNNAKEIIQVCEKNNVKLMVGHIERFNPIIPVIRKSIENNHVISINITRVGPIPPRIKDVGVVVDLAVHDIDLIRYLTNSEFEKIYGLTSKSISEHEDTAILSFEMKNGSLAQIVTSWLTPFKVREICIATKEKYIKGWFIEQKVIEYSAYKDGSFITKELSVPFIEPLRLELKEFIKSIKNGTSPLVTGEDGLYALQSALKSIKTRA